MLPGIFESFDNLSVLIVGDVMLDSYIWGSVERISPEAPVPVVTVRKKDSRLGGAANVALNVTSLGAKPILCALIGDDDAGKKLMQRLAEQNISSEGIVVSSTRPTTVKTRVITGHQHVVRVDEESDNICNAEEENTIIERIGRLLPSCQVVIFEDYDKGVITPRVIEATVALANKAGIPTVVDPKKRNFLAYKGVTLFKPNLKELRDGLKADIDADNLHDLPVFVNEVKSRLGAQGIMVTLSAHGVYIDHKGEVLQLSAWPRNIVDVSGAGDTVISIAALCVALNLDAKMVGSLSNLGGGLVCQYVGVVPINRNELLAEAIRCLA